MFLFQYFREVSKQAPKTSISLLKTILLLLSIALSGCNSTWFYRPSDTTYRPLSDISIFESQSLLSKSGNNLHTLLTPASSPSNRTLLVHFHGNTGNITWTSQRYGWLKEYGFDLLVFDYSGYGASTGQPSPKTTWQDADSILDYALALKNSSDQWDRIIVAGTSLGGNILLYTLSLHPQKDQFDQIFIDSSFLSYQAVAANMIRRGPAGAYVDGLASLLISDDYAPAQLPSLEFSQPILITHCQQDRLIPLSMGRNIFTSIDSPDKSLWLLTNCAHAQGFTETHSNHRARLAQLLQQL